MGKPYFKYKQFTVHQDKCAMKVCTDSSLFGALINPENSQSILDIGTGTGVLALMQAQKSPANIDAVEIERNAFEQAVSNIQQSPWKNRIKVLHDDIFHYSTNCKKKYDCVISNPPFFQNNLKTSANEVNLARHNESLSLEDLAEVVTGLLNPKGKFWVLLPEYEFRLLTEYFHKKLTPELKYHIYDRPKSKMKRVVGCFSTANQSKKAEVTDIYIKDQTGEYSRQFSRLLEEYYLIF